MTEDLETDGRKYKIIVKRDHRGRWHWVAKRKSWFLGVAWSSARDQYWDYETMEDALDTARIRCRRDAAEVRRQKASKTATKHVFVERF